MLKSCPRLIVLTAKSDPLDTGFTVYLLDKLPGIRTTFQVTMFFLFNFRSIRNANIWPRYFFKENDSFWGIYKLIKFVMCCVGSVEIQNWCTACQYIGNARSKFASEGYKKPSEFYIREIILWQKISQSDAKNNNKFIMRSKNR